jgi:peptidoglycan DL-endopeptidase CwlO
VLETWPDTRESWAVPDRTNCPIFNVFVWYGPALVARGPTRTAARLAAVAAALALAGVSAAGAAGPGASLRRETQVLHSRAHRAALDLYALEERLHGARVRLATLVALSARLRHEQNALAQQLSATRHTLAVSQRELGDNLSLLYKEGDVSALAVVLGSESLDAAVTRLDDLNRVADESTQIVAITLDAQTRFDRLRITLDDRRARLDAAVAEARTTTATLESARAERIRFIAELRRRQQLKVAQVHALDALARRAVRKAVTLQASAVATADATPAPAPSLPPSAAPVAVAAPAPAGSTLTVSSTGYSLAGRTATGLPTGFGVVAVDPAVIPLGTRLTIPGYGEAVAADTGSAVRGETIDLWFPTLAQARAWGRRTVTIRLH